MKNRFCFLLFLSLLPSYLFTQSTWMMDMPGNSYGAECTATSDGGVVAISFLEHKITKLDAAGALMWSFVIDTSALQYLIAVTETEDNGIVAVGSQDNWTASLVWKLDENGNLLWQKRFNSQGQNLTVHWICPAHGDGGFLIGGGECDMQFYVIRCDANGDILWQQQYYGLTAAATGYFPSLVQAAGSGYFATFNRLESGDLDWGILKIDDSGLPLWAKAVDEGTERDEVIDAVATSFGGMVVLGTTTNYAAPNNETKMTFTAFDAIGNIQKYRVYDYTEQLQPKAIAQTDDGGFVITGSTFSLETMIIKTDALGGVQWQKLESSSGSQEGFGVANAGGGMFYLSAFDFNHKATVAKLGSASGLGLCSESPLQLSPSTYVLSTIPITSGNFPGSASAVAINYPHHNDNAQPTTVCSFVGTEAAVAPQTLRSSPNPFADQIHIDLGEVLAADGRLQLYDLQGRLVAERQVTAGTRAVDWSLLATANGTYWLRLQADGATRSILVQRLKN